MVWSKAPSIHTSVASLSVAPRAQSIAMVVVGAAVSGATTRPVGGILVGATVGACFERAMAIFETMDALTEKILNSYHVSSSKGASLVSTTAVVVPAETPNNAFHAASP